MHAALKMRLGHIQDALGWRVRKLLGDQLVDRSIVKLARGWRPFLKRPVFVGITGSAGKTTTKELLLGILSHIRRGSANPASLNVLPEVAKTVLRVRPTHDFCVAELSEDQPGAMKEILDLVQPSIGIVTVVQDDHLSAFASRDHLAAEMGQLIASLPTTGTAVLNADDPSVLAMAANCTARVITFGTALSASLRAENISSLWPDRLRMTLVQGDERVRVNTQLCGTHWLSSVLGAIGGGLAAGLSLEECAEGISRVAPFDGRMQPVTTPDGVTFIRDDWKGTLWTVDSCFEFMRAAHAKRKIIVIGTLADCGSGAPQKYAQVAARAQEIAQHTIFVGPWASHVLKAKKPGGEDSLRAFSRVRDATDYINAITREDDLVLLKGTSKQDHLLRIILARTGDVACWRDDCNRYEFCNECPDRMKPSGAPLLMRRQVTAETAAIEPLPDLFVVGRDEHVVVGLGNPESMYTGTPHNIGYQVVDHLAKSLGLTWTTTPKAWIARGSLQGRNISLIKIRMAMNGTGAGLKQLSERMSFTPEHCMLVYDDLDIPIGSIRSRLSGGASGHRGVASILEAFQTDQFRRVKVGVDRAGAKLNRAEYVLTAFAPSDYPAVGQSILAAAARVLEMSKTQPKAP